MAQRTRFSLPALAILAALAAFLGSAGASADWLVTKEGARIETRGAWKVKGKLVVFTTSEGKLASLRAAEVDLDASRNATEEAVAAKAQAEAEPEPKKEPERKKSVRVITDKDVRQGPAASEPGLEVADWKKEAAPEDRHIVIAGLLTNPSHSKMTGLGLKVMLFDGGGNLIATSQAAFGGAEVPAKESVTFRADFPGFFAFDSLQFDIKSSKAPEASETLPPARPDTGGPGL